MDKQTSRLRIFPAEPSGAARAHQAGVVDVISAPLAIEEYLIPYQMLLRVPQQRLHLGHVLAGLTSDLERKNSEPIAVMHGLPRRTIQNFVGLAEWAWDPLREQQRREVAAEIGCDGATLIVDGSATPKKGKHTVGVARQWCGRLGKVDNCVEGIHAVYVGRDDQATMVESELYLPMTWIDDVARREKCHVPDVVFFETQNEIAANLIKRCSVELPFQWVSADEAFGRDSIFRAAVRATGKNYVIEVPRSVFVQTLTGVGSGKPQRADDLVKKLRRHTALKKLRVRYGEKQEVVVRGFMKPVVTHTVDGAPVREHLVFLLDADNEAHFYLAHLPPKTGLLEVARRAAVRHRVEEVFAEAKGEVGMDHFECRAWHGWHHHMTLVQMAHWFLVREQRRLGKKKYAGITISMLRQAVAKLTGAPWTPARVVEFLAYHLARNEEVRAAHYRARNQEPPLRRWQQKDPQHESQ